MQPYRQSCVRGGKFKHGEFKRVVGGRLSERAPMIWFQHDIDDVIRGVRAANAGLRKITELVNACRQPAIEKEAISGKAKQPASWKPRHKIR
jgi:hypothetical protein